MPEIILKINPSSGYEDGDVLAAFNRRRTRCVHAEGICHPWKAGCNSHGWRPLDSAAEHFHKLTYQYRFERVSQTEVLRTDLVSGETSLFGTAPNERGEAIDVAQFLARRRREAAPDGGPKAAIYGDTGREVWYGGRIDVSNAKLDSVWEKIAEKTGRLESEDEFQLWPMGRLDIRHHLVIRTTDFSDDESERLTQPLIELDGEGKSVLVDDQPKQLAKRRIGCDWRAELLDDLRVPESDVLDPTKPVGVDVVFPIQRIQHRSKKQPEQSQREKLKDKLTGGPVR